MGCLVKKGFYGIRHISPAKFKAIIYTHTFNGKAVAEIRVGFQTLDLHHRPQNFSIPSFLPPQVRLYRFCYVFFQQAFVTLKSHSNDTMLWGVLYRIYSNLR